MESPRLHHLLDPQPMYPILVVAAAVKIHKFQIFELVVLMKSLLQILSFLMSFAFSLFSPPQEEHHLLDGHHDHWHFEELQVTWAHLEKKRTRLRTYTNISQDNVLSGWRRRHRYNVMPSQLRPRRRHKISRRRQST
ncbi:hypothetical protein Tco_0892495 [Tanacetum coccineum]|uniref:Uncharacterized protein n=1 Tax=Tanacetum coccineum TaxID=301880 RepID=A0ABQ5C991_9ASTR